MANAPTPEERADLIAGLSKLEGRGREIIKNDIIQAIKEAQEQARKEEREAIAQFIETHTTEWSTGEVMPSIAKKPSPSQTSLANSIRQRSSE